MTVHAPAVEEAAPRPTANIGRRRLIIILLATALLCGLSVLSLFVGSGTIQAGTVVDILWQAVRGELPADLSTDQILVLDRRIPRTVLAILVGAGLGLAGALMQALTRNPLADPGLLGVNAGAMLAVVLGSAFMGSSLGTAHVWLALIGALITTVAVYVIGSTGRSAGSPAKLVLAGVALAAVFSGVSMAISLSMPLVFDRIRFWQAGSLQGRSSTELEAVLPFILVGVVIALFLPRALNALALGDDAAVALGGRPMLTRVIGLAAVTLLCGAATAAAGPLTFVGLMVPHALRMLTGPDYRWLLPLCVLTAPVLMLAADILARVIVAAELPVGVVTAFLGAPVLIYLTRRKKVRDL